LATPTERGLLGHGRHLFGPEHDAFRDSARRFFANEIEPNIRQWEKDEAFPRELFKRAADIGLLCAGIPTEYGGMGGDFLHHVILHEEHGYSIAGAALEGGLTTDIVAYGILDAGTEEQKRLWLPRMATGEVILEIALSEAHSGSDVQSIRTTARREGDDFVINGHKMWVTNGSICDAIIVAARLDDATADARKAPIGLFFIDRREASGVTVSPPVELMTRGAGGASQAFFDNVRVHKSAILGGDAAEGLKNTLRLVTVGRLALAARMLAACELALTLTVDYCRDREGFGQRVLDFQNTRFKLAQVKTEITVGRLFVDELLRRGNAGAIDSTDASMAKLWVSELEARVMDECLQLFGGSGFSNDYPISKMYSFARLHRLYIGTSEIQRLIIGRSLG